MIAEEFPDDATALLDALDNTAPTSIRLNSRKPCDIFATATPVAWCATGRYLPERPLFAAMPEWHAGAFYVQEAASMIHRSLMQKIVDETAGRPLAIIDLCAAPGGKSTAVADVLPPGSLLISNEVVAARAAILRENLARWGYEASLCSSAPVEAFAKCGPLFDVVIVDAPCSGEGMMRKEAEARRQWTPRLTQQCADLQWQILSRAEECLKPGGFLIYSTCTFNHLENELNVARCAAELSLSETGDTIRFMPHTHRSEGLFVAVMRKPGNLLPAMPPKKTPKSIATPAAEWIGNAKNMHLLCEQTSVYCRPATYATLIDTLRPRITSLRPGIRIAELKGRDIIPTPELALNSLLRRDAFPQATLNREEAGRFLRGESLTLPPHTPKRYILATFHSLPLGFLKNLGTRANNLYPKEWRLRMSL